jgi:hypothetical protein
MSTAGTRRGKSVPIGSRRQVHDRFQALHGLAHDWRTPLTLGSRWVRDDFTVVF